ncbi:hypothetical protein IKE07_00355 [Candidatus Saccharibacteria bacterium]|nr:hypothetical protein [Candidatus Saccharibacteria bacterium]
MEGTNIVHQDLSWGHDYTYYGNGCEKIWAEGGSEESCSTRIVKSFDDENQYIGVYYHFQAATSGSGNMATSPDNTNISDTFCPLGWQMPYSGTGGDYYDKSKSWNYLFNRYGYDENGANNNKIRSYPFGYVWGGFYDWSQGKLFHLNNDAEYWSITKSTEGSVYRFNSWDNNFKITSKVYIMRGNSVRCVTRY